MKPVYPIALLSILIITASASCVSKKKLTYLKYEDDYNEIRTGESNVSVTPSSYKIMPFDNLYIRVVTPDPQWSALFNTIPSDGAITAESAGLSGYSVDINGKIEIPFVGTVDVAGKTLSEIKVDLDSIFSHYLTDAAITVRLVNNFVSIIGEVRTPGRYPIEKDRFNVFEALAMAGDMTEYSNRQVVQLIRPSPFGPIVKEFSLSDRTILTSEYYYVMPNDIIYATPLRGRSFTINSSIYTLFLTTITTALVIFGFFRSL